MYPNHIENYHAPTELSEVLALLQGGDNVKLLAGGQTLIPLIKTRLYTPSTLIDLNKVRGLGGITRDGGNLVIGAMTRYHEVATSPLVRQHFTVLAEAVSKIADRQVRNRGTLAGSLAYGDYTSDVAPGAIAAGASVRIASAEGPSRMSRVEQFIRGPFDCDLREDEIVTAIEIPIESKAVGGAYVKYGRVAHDRVMLSIGVHLALDPDGRCESIRIAIGGVSPKAARIPDAEAALVGQTLTESSFENAGEIARQAIDTRSDELASARYRTQLIGVGLTRAASIALERAKAGST
jgi:aerobic carbon-monoxide dehydrogenase medium subunit